MVVGGGGVTAEAYAGRGSSSAARRQRESAVSAPGRPSRAAPRSPAGGRAHRDGRARSGARIAAATSPAGAVLAHPTPSNRHRSRRSAAWPRGSVLRTPRARPPDRGWRDTRRAVPRPEGWSPSSTTLDSDGPGGNSPPVPPGARRRAQRSVAAVPAAPHVERPEPAARRAPRGRDVVHERAGRPLLECLEQSLQRGA
jgi:hypothetical protein